MDTYIPILCYSVMLLGWAWDWPQCWFSALKCVKTNLRQGFPTFLSPWIAFELWNRAMDTITIGPLGRRRQPHTQRKPKWKGRRLTQFTLRKSSQREKLLLKYYFNLNNQPDFKQEIRSPPDPIHFITTVSGHHEGGWQVPWNPWARCWGPLSLSLPVMPAVSLIQTKLKNKSISTTITLIWFKLFIGIWCFFL